MINNNVVSQAEAQIGTLQAELNDLREARLKNSVRSFCEELKRQGKLPPAWQRKGKGFMLHLEKLPEVRVIRTGRGEDPCLWDDERPVDRFRAFLEALPPTLARQVELEEANREVAKFMEERGGSYSEALLEVSRQRPELF